MSDTFALVRIVDSRTLPGSLRVHADIINFALYTIDYSYFGCNGEFRPYTRTEIARGICLASLGPYFPTVGEGLDAEIPTMTWADDEATYKARAELGEKRFREFQHAVFRRRLTENHIKGILSHAYRMGCFPADVQLTQGVGFHIAKNAVKTREMAKRIPTGQAA